jgi:hypothetical protein
MGRLRVARAALHLQLDQGLRAVRGQDRDAALAQAVLRVERDPHRHVSPEGIGNAGSDKNQRERGDPRKGIKGNRHCGPP